MARTDTARSIPSTISLTSAAHSVINNNVAMPSPITINPATITMSQGMQVIHIDPSQLSVANSSRKASIQSMAGSNENTLNESRPVHYMVTMAPAAKLEMNDADDLKEVPLTTTIGTYKSMTDSKVYKMEGKCRESALNTTTLNPNTISDPTDESDAMYDNPKDGPKGTLLALGHFIALPSENAEISDNEMDEMKMDELPANSPAHLPDLPSHLSMTMPSSASMTLPHDHPIPRLPNGSRSTVSGSDTLVIQEKILSEKQRIETIVNTTKNIRDINLSEDETEMEIYDDKEIIEDLDVKLLDGMCISIQESVEL